MAITETASIYLNANDPNQPLFVSPSESVLARGMAGSSSDKVQLSVFWVTATGASPNYDIPGATDTVILSAKKRPSDATLIYEVTDWTRVTDSPAHYVGTLDLGVASDFWDNDTQAQKVITAQIIVRNTGNTERKTWIFPLLVKRGDFGSETPPDTLVPYLDEVAARGIFVAYDEAQTLTTEQQTQVRANIGAAASSGDGSGTFTVVNLTAPTGDADTALSQDGSILSVENGAPIGSSNVNGVARILTQSEVVTFINGTTPSYAGVTIPATASRGGVKLGTVAADGYSQEWLDGSGAVVGYVDKDGNANFASLNASSIAGDFTSASVDFGGNTFTLLASASLSGTNTGDQTSVTGNAGTATALQNARTIFGQSFDGTANVTGDLTTLGHLKSAPVGGAAGHLVLLQGTAPTIAAGNTALYGVSGGFGWRDGTGTAYTLTMGGNIAFTSTGRSLVNAATVKAANAVLYEEFTEYLFNAADMAATQSGTGYTGLDSVRNESTTFTTTAGVGTAFASFGAFSSRGLPYSGHAISAVPFTKRMEFSGTTTFITGYLGDANSVARIYIGGKTAATSGTVTSRAIGWKKTGGSANVFLSVHNGTTETTVDSGFAPTTDIAFSWRITSDGAGTVVLFINGTQVATTSAGPTATGTGGTPPFQAVEGVAGNATRQAIVSTAYRIRVYAN